MGQDLEKLVAFSRLVNVFSRIERVVPMPGTDRMENDTEHSYHLALMAWYLIDSKKLDLNLDLVIRYALVHDLVEIHAGDTYIWSKDESHRATKHEREAEAARQLKKEYPEFPDLSATIEQYEKREDRESKFVYALDKVVPMILIREEGGTLWKQEGVTSDMQRERKAPMVALSPEIEPYFKELVDLIEDEGLTATP